MKIRRQNRMILILCITCLSIGLISLTSKAQDEGPVLGRPRSTPQPQPAQPEPSSKKKSKRNNSKRSTAIANSPVPKGRSIDFYVTKGTDLIDAGDYELATLFFEEAEKHRKD